MKLNEVAVALTPDIQKKADRALKYIKSELKGTPKYKIRLEVLSSNKVDIILAFERCIHEKDLKAIDEDLKFAIEQSDKEGHVFKIEDSTQAHGYQYLDALLSGLRPGMTLKAEAFFPSLGYEVTWKQIMKR